MDMLQINKLLLLVQICKFVLKTSAVLLNLHEVANKNIKADGQVLQVISDIGFIMCSRKCAARSDCRGINFNKPHLKCQLLSYSVTATRPAEDWWYADNMDWLKHKNLALEMADNQCALWEKKTILSSGIPHCVPIGPPENCQDPKISSNGNNGEVFIISPQGKRLFSVYCDFETSNGPWTVIQRRINDTVNFDRPWIDYKTGFGNNTGSLWLGNDNIHSLLSAGNYRLRVDMERVDGTKIFAEYSTFYIAGEDDKYRLTVDGYSGTAGNALKNLNNMMFSTKDLDNDVWETDECAKKHRGGWWFEQCYSYSAFLNGIFGKSGWYQQDSSNFVRNVCMKVRKNN